MKKFTEWMERNFVPIAAKIGSQKHLVAIRDGFIGIMPVTMAGAVATLLNVFVRDLPNNYLPGPKLPDGSNGPSSIATTFSWLIGINGNVWWGTLAIIALAFSIALGYSLSKADDVDPLAGALVSVASFITAMPQDGGTAQAGWGNIGWGLTNANGLFAALIIGLIATSIYIALMKKNVVIKMPDSVPPAVSRAFTAIIPGTIAIFVFGAVAYLCGTYTALVPDASVEGAWNVVFKAAADAGEGAIAGNLPQIIFYLVQAPFLALSQGLATILIIVFFVQLFWFFGLHGVNVLGPVIDGMYVPALNANTAEYEKSKSSADLPYLWTRGSFDAFIWMGGSGCTIALLIAILIFSKKEESRAVAKLSAVMGCFNINEPVIFGLPIVLNPIYIIPWIVAPIVLTLVAYGATAAGLIPPVFVTIPWVVPPVIYAILATGGSITAGLVAAVNIVISVALWTPFIMVANRVED